MSEFRRPVRLERRSRALLLRSDVSANPTGRCRADCEDYRFFQTLCNEWVNHWNRCGRARRDSGTEMSASPPTDGVSDLPATRARYVRFAPKATVCHQAANLSLSAISGLMQCSKRRDYSPLIPTFVVSNPEACAVGQLRCIQGHGRVQEQRDRTFFRRHRLLTSEERMEPLRVELAAAIISN